MDFSKYKMDLTVKAICLFERLAGKSFFLMDMDMDDSMVLVYSIFCVSNPQLKLTQDMFSYMCGNNRRIMKWVAGQYRELMEQTAPELAAGTDEEKEADDADNKPQEETRILTVTDMATSLVIDYGMDAHYVMYEMNLWELKPFFEAADTHVKRRMEEERLWAYIGVAPHIDGKKIKSPEQLLPFQWETKTRKERMEKEMKNNEYAIKGGLIGRSIFGDKEDRKDVEGTDDRAERG